MSVQEIEAAITLLPPADLADLAHWFQQFQAHAPVSDPDNLTEEQVTQIRAGIGRGLEDCEAGHARPAAEWAAQLRHELHLPTHLPDTDLFPRF